MSSKLLTETILVNPPQQKSSTWIHRVLVALSQLFNTLLGGMPDETTSSRVHRLRVETNKPIYRFLEWFINCLFFFELNHCYLAYSDEVNRRHVHPDVIKAQDKKSYRNQGKSHE